MNNHSIYAKYKPATVAPELLNQNALWFAFAGDQMLTFKGEKNILPYCKDLSELGINAIRQQYLGTYDNTHCFSAEIDPQAEPPMQASLLNLRKLFAVLDEPLFVLAGRAKQIADWDRDHQFCGRCSTATKTRHADRSKICPNCGLAAFPRLAPAVIVAVTRGSEILLARANRFTSGWYSVLAGFVEPGETLEEAVEREVLEEVGIQVDNIQYFGSQPWPFPHSLMVGFTATYHSGDIREDGVEIADAQWFLPDKLPNIPSRVSIARRLIDHVMQA